MFGWANGCLRTKTGPTARWVALAVAALISSAWGSSVFAYGGFTCLMVYDGDKVHCYPIDGDSWRCDVEPTYVQRCIGSSSVDGAYPTLPDPTDGSGYTPPVYVDPTWMYVERIDDTSPDNMGVWVSADPRLDNFQVFCNAAPCGTGWGTGSVVVSGVSAAMFATEHVALDVQGCASADSMCAAARTRGWVSWDVKSAASTVVMFYLEEDGGQIAPKFETYNRTLGVHYRSRTWEVPAAPGNSRFSFDRAESSLAYPAKPSNTTVARLETLLWTVTPGSMFASECEMIQIHQDTLNPPNTITDWLSCHVGNTVGGGGAFEARMNWAWLNTSAGVQAVAIVYAPTLSVTVP